MEMLSPTLTIRVALLAAERRGTRTRMENGRAALLVSRARAILQCPGAGEHQKVGSRYGFMNHGSGSFQSLAVRNGLVIYDSYIPSFNAAFGIAIEQVFLLLFFGYFRFGSLGLTFTCED